MEVYIEYVLLDNLVINFLLLFYTSKILATKTHKWSIVLSAFVGAVGSVVFSVLPLAPIVGIVLKAALSCVMILIATRFESLKRFLHKLVIFYMLTFALGGVGYAVLAVIDAKIVSNGVVGYSAVVPLGVILLAIFVYIRLIDWVARAIYKKRNTLPFLRDIEIVFGEKRVRLKAFLDSGNCLIEKKTGLPVAIITLTSLMRVFDLKEIQKALETGKSKQIKNIRFISYSTIEGSAKKMMLFDADKMIVKTDEKDIEMTGFVMGLSEYNFKEKSDFEVLLNPALV